MQESREADSFYQKIAGFSLGAGAGDWETLAGLASIAAELLWYCLGFLGGVLG